MIEKIAVAGLFDASTLRSSVDANIVNKMTNESDFQYPIALYYIVKYIRMHAFPSRLKKDSCNLSMTETATEFLKKYRMTFPTGTMEFVVPKESRNVIPSL